MSTWNWYVNDSSIFIFLIFKKFKFYWRVVDLQCGVSFRCTAKWFSYIYTYIHSFLESLSQNIDTSFLKGHSCRALSPTICKSCEPAVSPPAASTRHCRPILPPPLTPRGWVPAPGTPFPSLAQPITACTPHLTSVSPSPASLHDPRRDTRKGVKGWCSVPGGGADLGRGEPSSPREALILAEHMKTQEFTQAAVQKLQLLRRPGV